MKPALTVIKLVVILLWAAVSAKLLLGNKTIVEGRKEKTGIVSRHLMRVNMGNFCNLHEFYLTIYISNLSTSLIYFEWNERIESSQGTYSISQYGNKQFHVLI